MKSNMTGGKPDRRASHAAHVSALFKAHRNPGLTGISRLADCPPGVNRETNDYQLEIGCLQTGRKGLWVEFSRCPAKHFGRA